MVQLTILYFIYIISFLEKTERKTYLFFKNKIKKKVPFKHILILFLIIFCPIIFFCYPLMYLYFIFFIFNKRINALFKICMFNLYYYFLFFDLFRSKIIQIQLKNYSFLSKIKINLITIIIIYLFIIFFIKLSFVIFIIFYLMIILKNSVNFNNDCLIIGRGFIPDNLIFLTFEGKKKLFLYKKTQITYENCFRINLHYFNPLKFYIDYFYVDSKLNSFYHK